MTNFRRLKQPGGTYFFTLVTFNRKPLLPFPISREILRTAWKNVQVKHPFGAVAICLIGRINYAGWIESLGQAPTQAAQSTHLSALMKVIPSISEIALSGH
ncbi:hypothetical protein hrd7_03180 [Leptolinea sp. HRD-7]|nr:hypothetical protein hrd7_03180 [Leptolinea sp. HRD-7]